MDLSFQRVPGGRIEQCGGDRPLRIVNSLSRQGDG